MNKIKLSIIIPCFNNINFTKALLSDLIKLSNEHEIIIVDNCGTDNTEIIINEIISSLNEANPIVKYIKLDRNYGFSYANDQAYKISTGKNILFLNNDIRVTGNNNWTSDIIKYCEEGYLVGTQGGLLDSGFSFIKETFEFIDSKFFYLSGWCLAASKETFDKIAKAENEVGPWSTKYFAFFEDGHLTIRAKQLEIPLKMITVPLHHFGRQTGKKLDINKIYTESRAIFRKEWFGKL